MNNEVIEITMNENETLMTLLNRMLSTKKENNKDVKCLMNGETLTTVDCENVEQAFIKNAALILNEYQKDRTALLSSEQMQKLLTNLSENQRQIDESNEAIQQLQLELQGKMDKLNSLNFDQPNLVLNWLNSITPYINNTDLLYLNSTKEVVNEVVKKISENGYSEVPGAINSMDDYRKYIIVYQLQDLNQFGFFAYDYADTLRDNGIIQTNTVNQDSNVYKFTVDSNAKVFDTLVKMWDLKQQRNQDIKCELNGYTLTTANCFDMQDIQTRNATAIFDEYEKDREALLSYPKMTEIKEQFKHRGNRQESVNNTAQSLTNQEIEFQQKMQEFETLNYKQPAAVLTWLNSVMPYINNSDLYLMPWMNEGVTEEKITDYIVKKLEENGYSLEKTEINTDVDYAKRLVSYQLEDLKNYGFFAYEYADNLKNQNMLNVEETKIDISEPVVEQLNEAQPAVEDAKIYTLEVPDNARIIDTFIQMWQIKKNNNQDVVCTKNKMEYSTVGCDSLIEIYTKYNNEFFEEYDNEMQKLIQTDTIQAAISMFSEENIKNHLSELEQQSSTYQNSQCNELQNLNLDYTNPIVVNNWLKELAAYINEPSVNVVVVDSNLFTYRSNQIVIKLKEYGYGTRPETITDKNDFYRRVIADKMEQLEQYHFFVKEYYDKNYDKETSFTNDSQKQPEILVMSAEEKQKRLELIHAEIRENNKNIVLLNNYCDGKIDAQGKRENSLWERQEENRKKMMELEEQRANSVNFDDYYNQAEWQFERIRSSLDKKVITAVEEKKQKINIAPTTTAMMEALEEAIKLPEENGIRNGFINTISLQDLKLNVNYKEFSLADADQELEELMNQERTEAEKKLYEEYNSIKYIPSTETFLSMLEKIMALPKTSAIKEPLIEITQYRRKELIESKSEVAKEVVELGIQNQKIAEELERRRAKYQKQIDLLIEQNQELANESRKLVEKNYTINESKTVSLDQTELEELNQDIEELVNSQTKSNPQPEEKAIKDSFEQMPLEVNPNYEQEPIIPEVVIEKPQSDNREYIQKLASIERVSTDLERRLSEEDSWMEVNTAQNLGRTEETIAKENQPVDKSPHKLINMKKASINLIQKIKEHQFVEKIKSVLDEMKKHKDAIIFTAAILGMAIAGDIIDNINSNNNNEINEIVPDTNIETEADMNVSMNIEEEIQNTILPNNVIEDRKEIEDTQLQPEMQQEVPTFTDAIEIAKQNVLEGGTVYTTASNALRDQNAKNTTLEQRENYWSNTEPTSYYTKEDGKLQKLSEEEAQIAWENGDQVAIGMENKGTTIGYIPVEQEETSKTM